MRTNVGEPFTIAIDDAILEDLHDRLSRTRWPDEQAGVEWKLGAPLEFVQRACTHWRDAFDWRGWEAKINRFEQRMIDVEGQKLHVLIEPGSGPAPLPLLLVHGWPGSFLEFIDVVEPLAHPERFGRSVEDAFTVIVPGLPGFGFSPPSEHPLSPAELGTLWHRLMVDVLDVDRYVAQGGDLGSTSLSMLALRHPERLDALHLNTMGLFPWGELATPLDAEELTWVAALQASMGAGGGYYHMQSTKPQTLAYGLTDSPAGLAAWILEKFHSWTVGGTTEDPPFDLDHMLANVMLFWINGINAANRTYVPMANQRDIGIGAHERVEVPTGLALFHADILPVPPRQTLDRFYNVAHLRTFEKGGHFSVMELPDLLLAEMREFFRTVRKKA